MFEICGIVADSSASISMISVYPNEEEVLLMAGSRFKVDEVGSGTPLIIKLTFMKENINDDGFCTICDSKRRNEVRV